MFITKRSHTGWRRWEKEENESQINAVQLGKGRTGSNSALKGSNWAAGQTATGGQKVDR